MGENCTRHPDADGATEHSAGADGPRKAWIELEKAWIEPKKAQRQRKSEHRKGKRVGNAVMHECRKDLFSETHRA
jgi:hypothetical protein